MAKGTLHEGPVSSTSASMIDNEMIVPIHPSLSQWIDSQSLLDGVSAFSPLMKQILLHMRQAKEEWDTSYITGLVVDLN